MSGERKERISISLYPSTLRRVNTEASKQNRSRSNLIETIIQTYFGLEPKTDEKTSKPLNRFLR